MNIKDINRISDLSDYRNKLLNTLELLKLNPYFSILIESSNYGYTINDKIYLSHTDEDNKKWIKDKVKNQLKHIENRLIEYGVDLNIKGKIER